MEGKEELVSKIVAYVKEALESEKVESPEESEEYKEESSGMCCPKCGCKLKLEVEDE